MDRKKVMAVEDNAVNLATIEQELSKYYEVIPMGNGTRALKYLERYRVDLVLLDVQMPGLNGIETLQAMRSMENGINVPVIFLTASKEKSTVIEGSKLRICDYIVKPFAPEKLHDRIEQALSRIQPRPIDYQQLSLKLNDIAQTISSGSYKLAVLKAESLLGYELDPDVSGRIESVKQKLKANDAAGASRILLRTIQLVMHNEQERLNEGKTDLAAIDIKVRVQLILNDIRNFKTEDAKKKIGELISYKVPEQIFALCQKALYLLNDYDEDSAEALFNQLLQTL